MSLDKVADSPGGSDQAQFLTYFAKDHQRIFGYIFSLLPNRADAEDVFQQVSLVLWQKFDQFDRQREFFTWACGIAYFCVRNFLRVAGRRRLCYSDELIKVIADERIESDQDIRIFGDLLDECLDRLNEADRSLIREVYGGDCNVKEVAESLSRAVQTIYNRLNLIRRKLLDCVQRKVAAS